MFSSGICTEHDCGTIFTVINCFCDRPSQIICWCSNDSSKCHFLTDSVYKTIPKAKDTTSYPAEAICSTQNTLPAEGVSSPAANQVCGPCFALRPFLLWFLGRGGETFEFPHRCSYLESGTLVMPSTPKITPSAPNKGIRNWDFREHCFSSSCPTLCRPLSNSI